jgi:serine/threonine-protein kinase
MSGNVYRLTGTMHNISMTSDPYIDREVGGFRIRRKLGEGGMGAVYVAEQLSLGRDVALKLLPASLSENSEFVERFLREARLAAGVSHPNVVGVHEAGAEEGLHFMAMELVRGKSLSELLRERGPLSESEVHSALGQAARGLGAAAKIGLIHRDIKPANILLTEDGIIKVADFGLAKNTGSASLLTQSGQVMGTPAYMSPEQGQAEEVDLRSDIYSLGATAFHLLTGRIPFAGDTAVAILMQHAQAPLPPPESIRPGLSGDVSRLIRKMMAKLPRDRFGSYDELLGALKVIRPRDAAGPSDIPTAATDIVTPATTPAPRRVFCIHCGREHRVDTSSGGKSFSCTACRRTSPITAPTVQPTPPGTVRPMFCVHCGRSHRILPAPGQETFQCAGCGRMSPVMRT